MLHEVKVWKLSSMFGGLHELSELYHRLGKFDLAEQYNARALSIRESVGGSHGGEHNSIHSQLIFFKMLLLLSTNWLS